MNAAIGFIIWMILFMLLTIFLVFVLCSWCANKQLKQKSKIFTSILLALMFLAFTLTSLYVINPNNFTGRVESITITKLDEVYKSNIPNQNFSCYYVSKLEDDSIYEITVSNVVRGDDNFVIKKEYEKGGTSYELVVTDIENIPPMKNFNK